MKKENKDVDLYDELKTTLDKSKEEEDLAPSEQKPKEDVDTSKEDVNKELSEDEISKLSPRVQKRIRDLNDKLKESKEIKTPEEKEIPSKVEESNFKNVDEFLNAVQDEPSRNLLKTFHKVIQAENASVLAPIEKANAITKFETEFSSFEKIDGLSDYKEDLKKTFLRNPNQSIKALVGEIVTDLQLNKIKPIESAPSKPNRDGKVNLDNLSKDDLYAHLDTLKDS